MKKYLCLSAAMLLMPNFVFADSTYVVRKGDTILKIADRLLGNEDDKTNPGRYRMAKEILAKNPEIKNANLLEPGQSLTLPNGPSTKIAATPAAESEATSTVAAQAAHSEVAQHPQHSSPATHATLAEGHAAPPLAEPADQPPVGLATPAPAENTHTKAPHSHFDFFVVQPRVQMDDFHVETVATKKKVAVHSDLNPGLLLGYGKAVGEHSHILIEANVNQVRMGKIDKEYTVDDKTLWLKNFSIGYATSLSPSVHLHAMALLTEAPLILPTATANYEVKTIQMPGVELAIGWHFMHLRSSMFGLTVAGEYLFENKVEGINYKAGLEPAAALSWETESQPADVKYRIDLRYHVSAQKSSYTEQHGASLGLRFNAIVPF